MSDEVRVLVGTVAFGLGINKAAVRAVNPKLTQFETSCFDGVYITGDVTSEYLASVEKQRDAGRQESEEESESNQLDLTT